MSPSRTGGGSGTAPPLPVARQHAADDERISVTVEIDDGRLTRRRSRAIGLGLLGAVLGATVFVHLFRLASGDGSFDEDSFVGDGWTYLHRGLSSNLTHPPLAKELFGYSQELFGRGITSSRLVAALAGIATAVVLAVWAWRAFGAVAAIVAAALWGLMPHAGVTGGWSTLGLRIERLAMLDPVATCFVAVALWAGWEAHVAKSWRWSTAAGAAVGLAACAKAPGVLIAPVVGAALVFVREAPRAWRAALLRGAMFVGGALVAVVVVYARFGWHDSVHQIHYMLDFQIRHGEEGHTVLVGNVPYAHAPWWAGLRFTTDGLGTLGTALVLALGAVAFTSSRSRPAAVYGTAAMLLTYAGVVQSRLMLPHYYVIWLPGLILTAAAGAQVAFDRAIRRRGWRVAGLVAAGLLAIVAVGSVWSIATVGPGDYGRAARLLERARVHSVNVYGYTNLFHHQSRQTVITEGLPKAGDLPQALVVDQLQTKRFPYQVANIDSWLASTPTNSYRLEHVGRLEVWVHATSLPSS